MLGYEHRMATHGRLSAIVPRLSRRQAFGDELPGVLENGLQTLLVQICPVGRAQVEAAAEAAPCKGGKQLVQVAHRWWPLGHAVRAEQAPPLNTPPISNS